MKKFAKIIGIIVALAVCACAAYGVKAYTDGPAEPEIIYYENPVAVEVLVHDKAEISGETIEAGLRAMGDLVTAEYYYQHVETYSSTRAYKETDFYGTENSFVYSYDGRVTAGIDFGDITVLKDEESGVITVTLPEAKITGSEVDQNSYQVIFERNNILNPISTDSVLKSFAEMKNEEEEKAVERGLLKQAQTNAEALILNFVTGILGDEEYDIYVKTGGTG